MAFKEVFDFHDWDELSTVLYSVNHRQVKGVLSKGRADSLEDFMCLISPAAENYLEEMAVVSNRRSLQRFGKTMQLYAPLYLSNECNNICTYCGYSYQNKIERLTLNEEQIIAEAQAVRALGFEHVLLVTGESGKKVGLDYFLRAIELIKPYFSQISIEVQPLSQQEYRVLSAAGVYAVLVYQETYHKPTYQEAHPKGRKANFYYRLGTPDRLGQAGMRKIGLGVLLGLTDWRMDALMLALHLEYLRKKYWQTKFSISFPRLRPAEGVDDVSVLTYERDLVQLIAAFRLFDENLELSLSTRESSHFRDHCIPLGITSMSAGSKTDPGGYAVKKQALKQFEISDERSPREVAEVLKLKGYEPVWKDWDQAFVEGAIA